MVNKQKNQNFFTLFENIPNELFIEILSYLIATDAVIAFSNLNYRFQCLIFEFCQSFDLTSISKNKFDIIFQYHNTNRWHSLKLSDDNNTPGQVKYFFENYFFIDNFSQLQSLSIIKIKPFNQYPLLSQLPFLTNLISLKIESICGNNISEFNLPKLKKLIFSSCANTNWLKNFSEIETIEYTIIDCCLNDKILIWPKILKHLKIIFTNDDDCLLIQQSLTHLSQLINLEIYQKEKGISFPNGQIWEQIILSSLPLLKNFKFYFQFACYDYQLHQVKQVIGSFSTPFYVLEKNWFIHCDLSARCDTYDMYNRRRKFAILYTIPFPFETLTIFKNSSKTMISNWSKNNIDHLSINTYKNIKTLIFKSYTKPDQNFNRSNIMNLIINTSFDSLDWIHVLTKLRHLTIDDCAVLSMENFNIFLDNTPYLYSLTAKKSMMKLLTDNWTDICVCNHLSRKIRSLTFYSNKNSLQYFNKNELEKILPIFSSKCQHLSLGVHSRNNTIDFILRKMLQLYSLHVHIQQKNSSPPAVEWLEQQHTRFNHFNCIIINDRQDHYFWLG
ncbi:unnamed protein product [Rotaria sordida]|uniref:F-box domain-containing protein n=2 Tax=Rotaria sordida TaxID=392033 RepID=A0A816A633_9BILA|nr:unnamed protein product [Rotaria sordida]CAF1590934.1 unnamed protein product [Rotaria sordida]